jgi:secernin
VSDLFDVLRDKDSCINFSGELLTVGSQVSALQASGSKQPDIHWFTATPLPDLSVFKPFIFCPAPCLGKTALCPLVTTDIKVRSGSQTNPDRRHVLYRMHEQGRELMEAGGEKGKKLLDTMRTLERQCVRDVAEFLDSFHPALLEEVPDLFKDVAESEVKFYK